MNASKSYSSALRPALDRVDLRILESEFFSLLGPSGCGKTTLLRSIAGFERLTDGEILLFGQPIGHLPPNRRPVNTVFQHYGLFPHMTVTDNIAFGLRRLGKGREEVAKDVRWALELARMTELADRKPAQLSGGQQQRVALARALAPRPKILLLDEPLSALDLKLRIEMRQELKRIQAMTDITFLFVTHDQDEALAMSDQIAVMSDGVVEQVGAPEHIYNRPASRFVATFIGETNLLRAAVIDRRGDDTLFELENGVRIEAWMAADAEQVAYASVRPEHVRYASDSTPDAFDGTIVERAFLGTAWSLKVRSGSTLLNVRQPYGMFEMPDPQIGSCHRFCFIPGTVRFVPDHRKATA